MKRIALFLIVLILLLMMLPGCDDLAPVPEQHAAPETTDLATAPEQYATPETTDLEFWITENVAEVDFSGRAINPGFGVVQYYGQGYDAEAEEYVCYDVTAYPDYSDGGSYVTRITIKDPAVKIWNGLTITSSVEEWDRVLSTNGYERLEDANAPTGDHVECWEKWSSKDGRITFWLTKISGAYEMNIHAEVTNREGIVF